MAWSFRKKREVPAGLWTKCTNPACGRETGTGTTSRPTRWGSSGWAAASGWRWPGPSRRPCGWAAFNTTRIEAGRALFGIDFDESVLPAETGLFDRAVSLTKGCYLGQEIVARMHARGQIARKLVGIRMENDALPLAGSKIYDDQQNEIGGVTSSTISPVLSNIAICLGYVKKPFFAAGTKLKIPAEGSIRTGQVVDLPFIGSPSSP